MLRYMLDTNICIFTIKNKPQVVREAFNRYHGQLAISTVTLMELIYGAEKSAAPERNLAIVEGSPHVSMCLTTTFRAQLTPRSYVQSWPRPARPSAPTTE